MSQFREIVEIELNKVGLSLYEVTIIKDYLNNLDEDTVKQGNSWTNKGKEGTHGKFKSELMLS